MNPSFFFFGLGADEVKAMEMS